MSRLHWVPRIVLILQIQCEIFDRAVSIKTGFSCFNRTTGFYADINSHCKIYHTCDEYGNKFTYRCPEETAFRQDALICDHAHLVRCQGNASNNAEEHTPEDKNHNFSFVTNSANRNHTLPRSLDRSQLEINSRIQYGFVFRAQESNKNISKTETASNMNPGNIQYPVKNIENSHSIKSSNDAPKLPSANYRDYPYFETLKCYL